MAEIYLSKGKVAVIDDEDLPLVAGYSWHITGDTRGQPGYAATKVRRFPGRGKGRQRTLYLHRLLTSAPDGIFVDHINHDTLDNRRSNLRLVTNSENLQNRLRAAAHSQTGVRGVYFDRRANAFAASVHVAGRTRWRQWFASLEEAAAAVAVARRQLMTHSEN